MLKEKDGYDFEPMFDYLAIEGGIKYTLNECIDSLSDDQFDVLCRFQTVFGKEVKSSSKNAKKKLKEGILSLFRQFLDEFDEHLASILKEGAESGGIIKNFDPVLTMLGMCFTFKKGDNLTFVIPDEIIAIFEEVCTDEYIEANMNIKILDLIHGYLLFNGIFPKKLFDDLIKDYYGYNVSMDDKKIIDMLEKYHIRVNKNGYYVDDNLLSQEDVIKFLEGEKDDDYQILPYDDIMSEVERNAKYCKDIEAILKDEMEATRTFLAFLIMGVDDDAINDYIDNLNSNFEKDVVDELKSFWDENQDNMRLWLLNGYTFNEIEFNDEIIDYIVPNKPVNNDLDSWLDSINEENYNNIKEHYEVDKLTKEVIIDDFTKEIQSLSKFELIDLLSWDEYYVDDDLDFSYLESGYLYVCEVNGQKMAYMPDELKKIGEEKYANMDDGEVCPNCGCVHDDDEYIADLVMGYLDMNGIIRRRKLQELLEVNHDISLALDELDDIVDDCCSSVCNDYYIVYEDVGNDVQNDLISLIPVKDRLNKYKTYDAQTSDIAEDFIVKLEDYLYECDDISEDDADELISILLSQSRMGASYEEFIDECVKDFHLKVSSSVKEDIGKIYKKYKNNLPLWMYNGYSFDEMNAINNHSDKDDRI